MALQLKGGVLNYNKNSLIDHYVFFYDSTSNTKNVCYHSNLFGFVGNFSRPRRPLLGTKTDRNTISYKLNKTPLSLISAERPTDDTAIFHFTTNLFETMEL